jgi:hypothetical protein
MTAVTVAAGLAFSLAGCAGGDDGGDKEAPSPSASGQSGKGGSGGQEQQPLGQVRGGKDGKLTLTVTSAKREAGGFATFKGTLKNDGPTVVVLPGWQSDEAELKDNGLSMAGATMVDKQNRKRYLILRDTEGRCLCTRFTTGFEQGVSAEWYAQFPAPPASARKVDFQVGDLPSVPVELSGE